MVFVNKLKIFFKISLLKSVYLNFHYLPFKQAIRMPILVSKRVHLRSKSGTIKIEGNVRPGMITFGLLLIFKDNERDYSYFSNKGSVIFKGHAIFHTGVNINVDKEGTLIIGENFKLGANSLIYTRSKVSFGNCVNISWNFQLTDTDFHFVKNIDTNEAYPNTKPIRIENNVWIGNHVNINKGVFIPNGCIISSNSFVNKKFDEENCIIAGSPAKVRKNRHTRVFDSKEEKLLETKFRNNV